MKILFAIQGTGNGHVSRARDIIPHLKKHGHVDLLISGTQADVGLEQALKYKLHGCSFIFGKSGGIDYSKTILQSKPIQLIRDIRQLPLEQYNLIVNDFEPISAWAARLRKIPTVSLSHQCAFLSPKVPRPAKADPIAKLVLERYARCTHNIGFHFKQYDDYINTPVIRQEIRDLAVSNLGHYTVYLPAYDDTFLVKQLAKIKGVQWQVFSKHCKEKYQVEGVDVRPVNNQEFNTSLASCTGILTGGGFEAPAEALFLGKKIIAVPMKGQYEQQCNAEALKEMGVPVIAEINNVTIRVIEEWVKNAAPIHVDYPYHSADIVNKMVKQYAR